MPSRETPEQIAKDAENWKRALTGEAPVTPDDHSVIYSVDGEPSQEYLLSLIGDLDAAGVSIRYEGSRPVLCGQVGRLSAETVRAVRKCKPFLIQAYLSLKGEDSIGDVPVPLPERGRRVEWVGYDDSTGYDEGERIGLYDWVRWRYVGSRIWYAYSGHVWEE